jgi:copper ion binding protein
MTKKIVIEGMSCGHCVKRVETALKEVCGIKSVKVNLKEKYADVELAHNVENAKIIDAIDEVGYKVVNIEE